MTPGPDWPNIANPLAITEADHAAHRSPRGVPRPEDLIPGLKGHKQAGLILKFAKKPHLKPSKSVARSARRKKKD